MPPSAGSDPGSFTGPVVFQTGSTFDVTLNGTVAWWCSTRKSSIRIALSGVNLGNAILAASTGYQYEQGDQYKIVSRPVVSGCIPERRQWDCDVLAGSVLFQVVYGTTDVLLTAQQSLHDHAPCGLRHAEQSWPAGHLHGDGHPHGAGHHGHGQFHTGFDHTRRRPDQCARAWPPFTTTTPSDRHVHNHRDHTMAPAANLSSASKPVFADCHPLHDSDQHSEREHLPTGACR